MSIFGEVWLWSVLAFLLGALLSWLLLARPVQKRNRRLEYELSRAHDHARTTSSDPVAPHAVTRTDDLPSHTPPQNPAQPQGHLEQRTETIRDFSKYRTDAETEAYAPYRGWNERDSLDALPKRERRDSPPGGFSPPEPIQPSMRSVERREPSEHIDASGGALFEPPSQTPAATESEHNSASAGPFGPGSALARPGGGRPADRFQVKASATTMRYCTDESPHFGRMVAEVWFVSAADAEQAGFRALST